MAGCVMIQQLTAVALMLLLATAPAAYAEQATIPAADGPLKAHWLPPAGDSAAPTVVLYPGCAAFGESFRSDVPLLMLLGAKDDWTPPARCLRVAEQLRASQPALDLTVRVYADGYHGFDGEGPVRFRSDVLNGTHAAGVHVGGSPGARRAALAEMDAFLASRLRGRPGSWFTRRPDR